VGILPIWELTIEEISRIIDSVRHIWLEEYFYRPLHYLFIAGLLATWVFYIRSNRSVYFLTTFISIGFVGIVVFFFAPLGQHDYYVIDLLMLSVFIMLAFFTMMQKEDSQDVRINSILLRIAALVLLILSVSHTSEKMEGRYHGWHNNRHQTQFYGFAEIEPYLDSLGIDRSTKVISYDDPSINISLYLMNRQGWSGYATNMNDSTAIARRIEMGAEYVLHTGEIDTVLGSHWKHFILSKVGQFENISIKRIGFPD